MALYIYKAVQYKRDHLEVCFVLNCLVFLKNKKPYFLLFLF